MHQTGILTEVHILAPMAPILDGPVVAFERRYALRRPDRGRKAGDTVAYLLMPCAVFPPDASELEDLSLPRPVQIAHQIGGRDQSPALVRPWP